MAPGDNINFFEQAYQATLRRDAAKQDAEARYEELARGYDILLAMYYDQNLRLDLTIRRLQGRLAEYETAHCGAELGAATPNVGANPLSDRPSYLSFIIRNEAGQGLHGPDQGATGQDH